MKLQAQRDFLIRTATHSDQNEVLALVLKYGAKTAAALNSELFSHFIAAKDALFRVILNSNGVVIGAYFCTDSDWLMLAVNPNFQKTELKQALLNDVKNWATEHSGGVLVLAPQMIKADWKTFVKLQGVKIENTPEKIEKIVF